MLKAKNITKTYDAGKKIALQDFSIEVPQGSIYGLLGPNGAGKTSFIRIINQITKPDSGEIFINDKPLEINHIREVGYMPEERGLYKNMTIGDQLMYFGELKGMSKNDILAESKHWFEKLEIDQWWKKKLSEKIGLIQAFMHRPKLLILDEPFSGFDPVNANLIKDQILDLKAQGTTIILSTHRMESVEELCDSVALVHQSRKVLDGRISEVKEKFKQNLFEIVLSEASLDAFNSFKTKNELFNEKLDENLIHFEIKNSMSQRELLQELLNIGKIVEFKEKIPTMNEVFIAAVKGI